MALTEMLAERPELLEQYRPYLVGFWEFFRFMQKPNGAFNHYFTAPGDARYYGWTPGQYLSILATLLGIGLLLALLRRRGPAPA